MTWSWKLLTNIEEKTWNSLPSIHFIVLYNFTSVTLVLQSFYIHLCKNEHFIVRTFRRKIVLQTGLQFINVDAIFLGFLLIPIFVVIFLNEKSPDKLLINRVILLLLQKRYYFIYKQTFGSIHPLWYLIFHRSFSFSQMDLFSEIAYKITFCKNLVQFFCLYVFIFLFVRFQM